MLLFFRRMSNFITFYTNWINIMLKFFYETTSSKINLEFSFAIVDLHAIWKENLFLYFFICVLKENFHSISWQFSSHLKSLTFFSIFSRRAWMKFHTQHILQWSQNDFRVSFHKNKHFFFSFSQLLPSNAKKNQQYKWYERKSNKTKTIKGYYCLLWSVNLRWVSVASKFISYFSFTMPFIFIHFERFYSQNNSIVQLCFYSQIIY